MRNVQRAEPKFFAWVVQIKRARRTHRQFFADGRDGPFDSLRRAIIWRNAMWARLGPPSHVKRADARNTSGILGVSREVQRTASGRIVENWIGKWLDADGRPRRRAFSIDKYGEVDAQRRAIIARHAGVAATNQERLRRWRETLYMQNRTLRHY